MIISRLIFLNITHCKEHSVLGCVPQTLND